MLRAVSQSIAPFHSVYLKLRSACGERTLYPVQRQLPPCVLAAATAGTTRTPAIMRQALPDIAARLPSCRIMLCVTLLHPFDHHGISHGLAPWPTPFPGSTSRVSRANLESDDPWSNWMLRDYLLIHLPMKVKMYFAYFPQISGGRPFNRSPW